MTGLTRQAAVTALLALSAAARGPVHAQEAACRPADLNSELLLRDMVRYATSTDTAVMAVRDSLRILPVPASHVGLVTDRGICRRARAAYQRYYRGVAGGFSKSVYVVKVGTRYAVLDPEYPTAIKDPPWHVVIMDADFHPLGALSSI